MNKQGKQNMSLQEFKKNNVYERKFARHLIYDREAGNQANNNAVYWLVI